MHTDGKSGAPGNAQSNEDIRSGGKNGAEGGKTAAKDAPSGRRRVRPYCIAMAFAALTVLVLPVLIRPVGAQEAAAYLVPVLAVTVLPALIIYLTVLRKLMADRELARRLTLLCWQLPQKEGGSTLFMSCVRPLCVLLAASALIGTLLLVWARAQTEAAICIAAFVFLLSGALALDCAALHWDDMGGERGFRLCHNALYIRGVGLRLDGVKNAVYDVHTSPDGSRLFLGLQLKNNINTLSFDVPEDKKEETEAFISGLKAHFEQQNAENAANAQNADGREAAPEQTADNEK